MIDPRYLDTNHVMYCHPNGVTTLDCIGIPNITEIYNTLMLHLQNERLELMKRIPMTVYQWRHDLGWSARLNPAVEKLIKNMTPRDAGIL